VPLDDALQIAREVADALSHAHSHDVVRNRDIKLGEHPDDFHQPAMELAARD
jgi:serine/threonine protein kinase